MKVTIEEIKELRERMRVINSQPLTNITFTENGKVIDIDHKIVEDFIYTGLNNMYFITSDFYKTGFEEFTK